MPLRFAHAGDFHVEEDRYFDDTVRCLEWFVADAIRANVELFVINGDLTTCKQTIKERNLWVDTLIQMGNHAPVVIVADNHGKELEGDLHVLARAQARHLLLLCTELDIIEIGEAAIAVFP
jgi:predicted MPP superfamily phosphohydrolase